MRVTRALMALAVALMVGVIVVGTSLSPVLRVIQSDRWYEIDEMRSGAFVLCKRGDVPRFSRKQCSNQPAIVGRTGYPENDVVALCLALGEEGSELLAQARNGQWFLTALASFMLGGFLFVLLSIHRAAQAAVELHDQFERQVLAKAPDTDSLGRNP